ncbi:MAG: hypothetical protein NXI31_03335 [bacterium]|nr:hypothetical protein [bacterium]
MIRTVALFALGVAGVPAQGPWASLPSPGLPFAAYDAARDVTLMLGRDGVMNHWEWDGSSLIERVDAAPPGRNFLWVGGDAPRGRVLAVSTSPLEISEWDGAAWRTALILNGPEFGSTTSFAFDDVRARLVAFHIGDNGPQTFEWDGSQWYDLTPVTGPGERYGAALEFDRSANRCVLYGGNDDGVILADCWAWDGVNWTQIAAAAGPGPRAGAGMAFSPMLGGLMLYGGAANRTTWYLQGSTWIPVLTSASPPALHDPKLVQDPFGMLLVGGRGDTDGVAWRYDGVDWQPVGAVFHRPAFHGLDSTIVFDRGRGEVVHYAGLFGDGEVSLFDTTWRGTRPAVAMPARNRAAIAWSSAEQQVLLFGGIDASNTVLGDTWNWDGVTWIPRSPANSPSPRRLALAAEDPNGGVLLYSGLDPANNELDEHWHWDGTNWSQRNPATRPTLLSGTFAALDPNRGIVVAVSRPGSAVGYDTWEWDGQDWRLAATSPYSTLIGGAPLAFDGARNAVIAAGGRLYEWTGTSWTGGPVNPSAVSPGRGAVTDFGRQRTLLVGTPVRQLTDTPASLETRGAGCSFGPAPVFAGIDRPQPGNVHFALEVATRLPNAATFVVLGFGQQAQPLGSGCTSYVANPVGTRLGVASAGAQSRFSMPIPNDGALRGVAFVAQGAVVDPARSLIGGVTVTAGLRVTIGD